MLGPDLKSGPEGQIRICDPDNIKIFQNTKYRDYKSLSYHSGLDFRSQDQA